MSKLQLGFVLFFLLTLNLHAAITEQQCLSQLTGASGLPAERFEYVCNQEQRRSEASEYASCFNLLKSKQLDEWEYVSYCTSENGHKDSRQAVNNCLNSATASDGVGTRHSLENNLLFRLCKEENVRSNFASIVTCAVEGTPLFVDSDDSETFNWDLIEVCEQGGSEAVSKVKTCTTRQKQKFLQLFPEASSPLARVPSERREYFTPCTKPEVYNNLEVILTCQDRVGHSARRLVDESIKRRQERNDELDEYFYRSLVENGTEALEVCNRNATLSTEPEEVMACVDELAQITRNSIFDSYEGNSGGILLVSIRGSYFDLHIERCASAEKRQFQTEVLACVNRLNRFVPRTDQAMAGGSYIYCEMFTAANQGLNTRSPAELSGDCPR